MQNSIISIIWVATNPFEVNSVWNLTEAKPLNNSSMQPARRSCRAQCITLKLSPHPAHLNNFQQAE
jgi:hypothetical protein